jgi:hypothetical protein
MSCQHENNFFLTSIANDAIDKRFLHSCIHPMKDYVAQTAAKK